MLCVHTNILIVALVFIRLNFNITGLRGTYKGLLPTILKQSTNQAIRFFVFNEIKKFLQAGDKMKDIGVIQTFCAGGMAGAASVFGNTPIDVVKTRMQVCYMLYSLYNSTIKW